MKRATTRRLLVLAAVAVPLFAGEFTAAQFQIDNSRSNDASNRLGSGGYNGGGISAQGSTVNPNDIVTGNVTGGQSFRGRAGYRGVGEFTGQSATYNYDQRLRDFSSPQVSYNNQETNYSNTPRSFYSSVAAPPQGYVRSPVGSGFVAGQSQPLSGTRFDERLGVMTNRLGDSIVPRPGQLVLPGPVDASANQTFIAASPLTGVRQVSVGDPSAAALLGANASLNNPGRAPLTDEQILKMRRELGATMATPDLPNSNVPGGQQDGQAGQPGQGRPLGAFDAPEGGSLSPKPFNDAIASRPGDASTGQSQYDRFLVPPSQQSTQYAEMRKRLERYNPEGERAKTDEERSREARALRRAAEEKSAAESAVPKVPTRAEATAVRPSFSEELKKQDEKKTGDRTGSNQTFVQTPSGGVTAVVPTVADPGQPVEVRSLAAGVKAPGLKSLLEQAEANMREGKFDSAIAVYESALQVAPNNPMILLGQANAELGGEYFARAENHLKQSFLLDPTLLMARYDVRAMLGDQRLDKVIDSLKKIAAAETKQSRPAFLLAYVAYNSQDTERAASYLELAEQRAGSPDPVFRLLRSHWSLPKAAK